MPEEPSPASLRSPPSPALRERGCEAQSVQSKSPSTAPREREDPARKGWVGEGLRCAFARWPCVDNGLILLQDAATGGGTRHQYIIRFVDRPPGRRIRENGVHGRTGPAVDEHDARPLGREMPVAPGQQRQHDGAKIDRKSTRLNSSHGYISYAVFCLKKKKK